MATYTDVQICNKALGLLSADPITGLCDESCSDPRIDNKPDCEAVSDNTWTDSACSDPQYTNESDCLATNFHTWTGFCSDSNYSDQASCLALNSDTWGCIRDETKKDEATCTAHANTHWVNDKIGCVFDFNTNTQTACNSNSATHWVDDEIGCIYDYGLKNETACNNGPNTHWVNDYVGCISDASKSGETTCISSNNTHWVGTIDNSWSGSCSDPQYTNQIDCESTNIHTWNVESCSDPSIDNETDCLEVSSNTWELKDKSVNADLCRGQYYILRDALLSEHVWTFAIKNEKNTTFSSSCSNDYWVNKITCENNNETWTDRSFDRFSARVDKPNNSMRIVNVADQSIPPVDVDWAISEGYIYTVDPIDITVKFVKTYDSIEEDMSAPFADMLSLRIAAELCYTLTASSKLYDFLTKQYEQRLYNAKNLDSIQGTNVNINFRSFAR